MILLKDILLAAELCVRCKNEPTRANFGKLTQVCRKIGNHLSKVLKLIPPTERRMVVAPFDGAGMIDIGRTIVSFCSFGKSIDNIIERKRDKATRESSLAIIYDDSNSMTGWWRKEFLKKRIPEEEAPQTFAKVSTISLIETFGKESGIDLIFYSSKVDGPYKKGQLSYNELIKRDGSGASRLDLAISRLIEKRWHKRGGKKYLVILTDGVPEVGRDKASEDTKVQDDAIRFIKTLLNYEVKVLYVPILTDTKLAYKNVGSFNAMSFSEELKKMGITVKRVAKLTDLPKSLFEGMKQTVVKVR